MPIPERHSDSVGQEDFEQEISLFRG